ncbi:MAG: 3-methyl-2-oxobutanoate hydroxymethyltransferase [Gammaproteobacteria bacterium RIFCSPHIGHO2_12_FULL_38_14]|nr:MAG: 3-methyl-2-oxobutanoate hydroxymethyltransferase [Gammaproteobacteria bacterium RIFCSPHIGHO2_12_FULL_38_14]
MSILKFHEKKGVEKISMVTCYDYTSARLFSQTSIDCLLVGDSVAMTMHGFKDTTFATLEMMCFHTQAVARGAGDKFILGDMPFLSYRKSLSKSVNAAQQLIQSGAHAIKLEGAAGNEQLIRHLTESGIPVMGHVGLTPQLIHTLGGYKIQGRTDESIKRLKNDILLLQEAGCFAIVLECVTAPLARELTAMLSIPTIGIGSGPDTDGQVLVMQDLLGLNNDFKPRFVKNFMNGAEQFKNSIENYIHAIQLGEFPNDEHSFMY